MEDCLQTFRADGTKIKDGEKVPSGRRKRNNRDMAAVFKQGIKNDAKVQGSHPPRFLRKKALSELAESASVAAPETLLKPKPKTKRVRKNPPAPVSFLQKEQQAD
ncbi:hypothetical protein GGF37_000366 [Kickxella alabastrina]|nr:hypothetical protein GGF37_000366 [Kickxella alabastrina]